ncbi:helix-turn-helix domain-containing protein [Chromohalobacter israelensis]|uniref:helix-turn-helix domain-containing protein n=1 Tax=Chromohalobacter israelensis TaxID=141390 RepID=UPI00265C18C9|nr:helix-turn-helix transcriptional regulator [Chromohalobacter salexigens]MDO0945461.1 helix-turn-helix transcriptional regulator [Chromohalobacter salexigens]
MSVLKSLRESRNLNFSDLADKIDVSSEDVERWEKDPGSLTEHGLSGLAYCFGLSSEDLLAAIDGNSFKLTTSDYYINKCKDFEDGWWGHFGVRLNGQDTSKWFPITLQEANRVSRVLSSITSREEWMIVETLNNRILVFRPTAVSRLWLLDEAADEPDDDWQISWDGYSGKPGEFYKGLEEYYWEGVGCEGSGEVSSIVRKHVEAFTDIHDLDLDQVRALVVETQIYDIDGGGFSYDVGDSRLSRIVDSIELELPVLMFELGNENGDLYVSADSVSLIDIPKRRLESYRREELKCSGESEYED